MKCSRCGIFELTTGDTDNLCVHCRNKYSEIANLKWPWAETNQQFVYSGAWVCPKCGSVYGPSQPECIRCNSPYVPVVTC